MEQRWLSATGICTVLGIGERQLKQLVKAKALVRIGTKSFNTRYLDPTPEYAEQLRLGQLLHSKAYLENHDVSSTGILTMQEIAQIMDWKISSARVYVSMKKVAGFKIGKYHLYPSNVVRDMLWRRQGRKQAAKRRGSILLKELIDFFWRYYKVECEETPTDLEFEEDDLLQRKLIRMMMLPSPARELAVKDFMDKVDLAKRVVAIVKSE